MRQIAVVILTTLMAVSCVSKKKLTYLQGSEDQAELDSVYFRLNRVKYDVQPNDILNITVRSFDEETSRLFNTSNTQNINAAAGDLIFYLNGYTIDFEGYIDMPVVGRIQVAGLNVEEVKVLVQSELNNFFNEDAVHVNVQLAGVRYSVVGDVTAPGKYVIYQNQVNIFEALALAGDITIVGDRKDVQIVRQTEEGVVMINVDLTDSEVLSNPYFFIQPNDIINVKPLGVKSVGIGTTGFQTIADILAVLASTATLIIAINSLNSN